jgi:hypothetical protein
MFSALHANIVTVSPVRPPKFLPNPYQFIAVWPLTTVLQATEYVIKASSSKYVFRNTTIIVICLWKMHLMLQDCLGYSSTSTNKSSRPALEGCSNATHHELGSSLNTVTNHLCDVAPYYQASYCVRCCLIECDTLLYVRYFQRKLHLQGPE